MTYKIYMMTVETINEMFFSKNYDTFARMKQSLTLE